MVPSDRVLVTSLSDMASDLALTLVKNFKAIPVSAKTFQQNFTANHAVKEGVHSLCVDHAISWRWAVPHSLSNLALLIAFGKVLKGLPTHN